MAVLQLVVGALLLVMLVAGLLNYFGNRTEHACRGMENPLLEQFCVDMAYTQSGEFTVMRKFRSAVRYNLIYQLIIGTIALIGLVGVIYVQGTSNLRAYVMALSNSWGLVLVVIFMGYGMVDVPRRLWHKGDNSRELRRISFKASVVKDKRQDTEDEVHAVAKELSVVCHRVQLSDPLRPFIDQMVENSPAVRGIQFESSRTASPNSASHSNNRGDLSGAGMTLGGSRTAVSAGSGGRKHGTDGAVPAIITEKYLADLHARIKRALRMSDRWNAIWQDLLKAGFLAQDIQENADNPDNFPLVYNYLTISTIGKEDSTVFAGYMGKIDMVPFLGEFNYYMPYMILVPTVITLFNVFAKMFAICSISDNFFDNDDDEGGIGGDLEEGVQVLKDARRDEERRRMPERAGLNRDFTARRGAAFEMFS
ncbi:hypothetical protein BGZ75_000118 [Mortierella antarctica]|nr:hypothetical protein BGZ75_000118 [Mortierella antarctica]